MSTIFAAMIEGDAAVTLWVVFTLFCVGSIGWLLYMATFHTDDFLRLLKAEQERKRAAEVPRKTRPRASAGLSRWRLPSPNCA